MNEHKEEKQENKTEDEDSKLNHILQHIKDYIHTRIGLYKLSMYETLARTGGASTKVLVLLVFGLFFMMFLSIAFAILIGEALGNIFLGFLIVAGFYLLFTLLSFIFGNKFIKTPVTNIIIRALTKNGPDEPNN